MSCTNCGSPFHEKWACTKPLKPSAAVTPQQDRDGHQKVSRSEVRVLPAVDTLIIGKRRGRPQTITDMKAYKAKKERERRAKLKNHA